MRIYTLSIILLILAVVVPKLNTGLRLLWKLRVNLPPRLQRYRLPAKWSLDLEDQVRNCEDLIVDEASRWAILSCNPGRDTWNPIMGFTRYQNTSDGALYLYDFSGEHQAKASSSPTSSKIIPIELRNFPDARVNFHPLGITYHATSKTLFVINTARGGSRIEVFRLDLAEHAATHVRTIRDRRVPAPNQMHAISATELYVSNDHYFDQASGYALPKLESFTLLEIAPVVYVDLAREQLDVSVVARHSFSNGLVRLNATTFAVASSMTGTVRLYDSDPSHPSRPWKQKASISVPMLPDNLSADKDGVLYIAGHGHPIAMTRLAKQRFHCSGGASGEGEGKSSTRPGCRTAAKSTSVVSRWTAEKGLEPIYLDDEFSAGCSAVKDSKSGIGIISTLYGKGILTWRE